jgi:hypothetical protein
VYATGETERWLVSVVLDFGWERGPGKLNGFSNVQVDHQRC